MSDEQRIPEMPHLSGHELAHVNIEFLQPSDCQKGRFS